MMTGLSEDEAKADLCRAVAERNINVQVKVAEGNREKGGRWFTGAHVEVPQDLEPEDLDWNQSRPHQHEPWRIGPVGPDSYSDPYWTSRPLLIDKVKVSTADVQRIFGSPKPNTDDEALAAVMLSKMLIQDPHLKLKDALERCREKYPKLSKRGFHQRVWPEGRKLAGLTPKARAGPKPKSSRSTR
jgi:hypothetical protein